MSLLRKELYMYARNQIYENLKRVKYVNLLFLEAQGYVSHC